MPCNSCTTPGCTGFPCLKNLNTIPANLTENDLKRGGWNDHVSDDELARLIENAKHATEQGGGWPPPGFGKFAG